MNLDSSITTIKGIGEKTEKAFAKMGVYTVGDILLRFPRNYVKYPIAIPAEEITSLTEQTYAIRAKVTRRAVTKQTKRMQITLLELDTKGGKFQCIWYRMPYIQKQLEWNKTYVFYGKISIKDQKYTMEQPTLYTEEAYEAIQDCLFPVYSLTSGITNNLMSKTIRSSLAGLDLNYDILSKEIRNQYGLCEYNYALKQIHFPDEMDALITARKRLVFEEFFLFILRMQLQKEKEIKEPNHFSFSDETWVWDFIKELPFPLTDAQKSAISDVLKDLQGEVVMQRLVQGDVGSGKTIVAFLMMAFCARNGYQSAIMAPTEVLAKQHYITFCEMVEKYNLSIPVILLTGSMTAKEKKEAYKRLAEEPNAMIIGTHALIQEKAVFSNLALVVTDEQHRFGVKQRDTFAEKGLHPHVLVMSATPIPRTLAIIIYGDMDISVIDQVPAKRLPIKNCVVNTAYRPKAYSFIQEQVEKGHQVYVICPLVEESEQSEGENVIDYASKLESELNGLSIGILHGKMKADQKNEIMERFSKNEIQVLVSTTVVEVGVNVPNATVMLIENADRFGLAQLHQLRGRVGRGDAQSYCIMMNTSDTKTAKKRLEILNQSNDGFFIASEDLKLRGPGDFFGIRQSGEFAFILGDIYQDATILQDASEAVKALLQTDPTFESCPQLKKEIKKENLTL